MANARLLRQHLSDYNKKLGKEQGAYQDRYAAYKGQYDQYAQQAAAYNQKIEQFNANTSGLKVGDIYQGENGTLMEIDHEGNPVNYMPGSSPYKGGGGRWYRDARQQSWDEYGNLVEQVVTGIRVPVKAFHPGAGPTAPATPAAPEEIKPPSFTVNDLQEMANPGQTQAELAMSAARGYLGKSQLAAENDPGSRNSAFADLKGDDPNQLKERGLVAQALAGQI